MTSITDKDQIIHSVRATLISVKGAITIEQCNRDYRELIGEWIPYKVLGFPSLEKLFLEVPGFKVTNKNGVYYVDAVPSKETQSLVTWVSKQKSSSKKSTQKYNKNWIPNKQNSWRKPSSSGNYSYSNYNNQYSNQCYRASGGPNTYGYNNSKANTKYNKIPDSRPTAPKINTKTSEDSKAAASAFDVSTKQSLTSNETKQSVPSNETKQSVTSNETKQSTTKQTKPVIRTASLPEVKSSKKLSASQRLSNLRDRLNTIPLSLPAIANEQVEVEEPPIIAEPPPDTASATVKLEWTCKKLGLADPSYKVTSYSKRGEYDCKIQVGTLYTESSYPNSSPTEELAREVAALKLLATIEGAGAAGLPASTRERMLRHLPSLVADHPAGVWANTVPHLYRDKYEENLPSDWLHLIERCPSIYIDKMLDGRLLLLSTEKTELEPAPETPISDTASEDLYLQYDLPPLLFPEEGYWNVYVTVANSPLEIWCRIIGEEYSESLQRLLEEMSTYYTYTGIPVETSMVVENAWYAVSLDDGGWQRAKVLEINGDTVSVFLGDHGDEDSVHISKIKLLEPEFRKLPAQGVLCRLEGAEELATSVLGCELVHQRLVGDTLVAAPGPRDDPTEPTVSVVLYDTSTARDLNLNKEIIQDFCIKGSFSISQKLEEVEVGSVTEEGRLWVSRAGGTALVDRALTLLLAPGPYRRQLPASPRAPSPDQRALYIVRTIDGNWVRCKIISGLDGEGTVRTQLVDSGLILRAPLSSLIPLESFSPALNLFPPQAVQVRLYRAERLWAGASTRLRELVAGQSVLCRAADGAAAGAGGPQVELFVRTGPHRILASVYNALVMEHEYTNLGGGGDAAEDEGSGRELVEALHRKKERIFTRTASGGLPPVATSATTLAPTSVTLCPTLPPTPLPVPGKCFDVFIAMVANPCNFVIQANSARSTLQAMMKGLQEECPKLSDKTAPLNPTSGELYTMYLDKDECWYRVMVSRAVSTDMFSVAFVDYGDLGLVSPAQLRPLPAAVPLAAKLPPQAMKAKLHDISPLHQDWAVEDCIRFQELCYERQLVGVCTEVGKDPLNPDEPLLTLDLIDTSTVDDVYINKLLVAEGRARHTSDC